MSKKPLLAMAHISKSFSGVKALSDVSYDLREGEVHALLGENGAGKSTLIKILAGIYMMDEGEISINGERVEIHNARDARDLGISIIHQEISLVPKLSVADNIMLGTEGKNLFLNHSKRKVNAKKAMEHFGFDIDVEAIAESLSIAQQQIVEIVRALATHNSRIIVMDEPTASISESDSQKLFKTIENLKTRGIGVIYISHRMEEVMNIADRITVLRDGNYIDTKTAKETNLNEIVEMMVGRHVEEMFSYNISEVGDTILEMKNISNKHLKDVSFSLKKGEVHGLYGLIGAGRTELIRVLFGLDAFKGEILINGDVRKIKSPKDAMNLGIGLVPENRKIDGLFLENTIHFNIIITVLSEFMKGIKIRKSKIMQFLKEYRIKLKIKYSKPSQKVETLSGGNQQKIVLAKWIATKPKVLILDEPTRGIDIGAKTEIYDLIFKLVKEGVSIILISSELPEIINLCTRVSIMREGKLVGRVERENFSQKAIFEHAIQ